MSLRIAIRWTGLREWRAANRDAARRLPREMEKNLRKSAVLVRDQAKKNVSSGQRTRAKYGIKAGRRVRLKKPFPVTAAPDRLGVFEERLRNSLSYDIDRRGRRLDAEIGSNVKYARVHELGGHAGRRRTARMPKRPFLEPAIEKMKERVFRLIGRTFRVVR